jgi:phosphoenolpyruvate-protein phosphotransferase (PTS system enzyme I)
LSAAVHRGVAAAPGVASGPLVRLAEAAGASRADRGTPVEQKARLETAIAAALAELEALAATADEEAAAIVGFQIAMLEDEALSAPAFAAIEGGAEAASAWRDVLGSQVAEYRAADDELFRARASDLADLMLRVETRLAGAAPAAAIPDGAILLAEDLGPAQFLSLAPHLAGIALEAGSPAGHLAILARGRGLPLVTGLGRIGTVGPAATIDGDKGSLVLLSEMPAASIRRGAAKEASIPIGPALTRDGERVELMLNLDDPAAIDDGLLAAADGVGLWRTELLFLGRGRPPDEDEQYAVYTRLLARLGGRPCTIRTLDIGGDKPLPGLDLPAESNPFLGLRGLRLCLERPDLFLPQLTALARAATTYPLQVMLPMVTAAEEVEEARALLESCLSALGARGVAAARPALGIMVETPAAALALDTIRADFLSIGSNDLVQYVTAASRDAGGRVRALADPRHPAVRRLLSEIVEHGHRTGLPVSLCGDLASDPEAVPMLLRLGLRRLSVAPAMLGPVKHAIASWGGER